MAHVRITSWRDRGSSGRPLPGSFWPTQFVITWFILIGPAGLFGQASIATPGLFDATPAREPFVRV
jgi:hypothetical protein